MKKGLNFLMKTVLVLGLFFAAGCSTDDGKDDKNNDGGNNHENNGEGNNNGNNNGENPINPYTPVADPEGTITMFVRNSNNGATMVPIGKGHYDSYDRSFGIDNGNNFINKYSDGDGGWRFASVGEVKYQNT